MQVYYIVCEKIFFYSHWLPQDWVFIQFLAKRILIYTCILYVVAMQDLVSLVSLVRGCYAGPSQSGASNFVTYGILNEYVVRQTQCWRTVRAMGKYDVDKLVEDLISAPWTVMETLEDGDSQWEFWKKQFTQVIDSHIPLGRARVREKTQPWIDWQIRMLMRTRNYFSRKARGQKTKLTGGSIGI